MPASGMARVDHPDGLVGACCRACGEERAPNDDGYCRSCGMKHPAVRDHLEQTCQGGAAVTDRGRRHSQNQDAFALEATSEGRVLAVVCDGVSTTARAGEASQRAAHAAVAALLGGSDDHHPAAALGEAYDAARRAVGEIDWVPGTDGLGTPSVTFLAVSVIKGDVRVSSLGDCRAFWLPEDGGGKAQILTEDDSWAAEQVRLSEMSAEVAYADPRSHSITRWVGDDADPSWEPRCTAFTATGPGRLVLCSDGLWNYAPSASEVGAIAGTGSPLAVGRRLVDHANGSGGHDNITVVVIDVVSAAS